MCMQGAANIPKRMRNSREMKATSMHAPTSDNPVGSMFFHHGRSRCASRRASVRSRRTWDKPRAIRDPERPAADTGRQSADHNPHTSASSWVVSRALSSLYGTSIKGRWALIYCQFKITDRPCTQLFALKQSKHAPLFASVPNCMGKVYKVKYIWIFISPNW